MKGHAPHEPRHIVLLVHGPASVTKSAIKRSRRLAGKGGVVSLVPATADAIPLVSRHSAESTRDVGVAGVTAVDASAGALPLVILHDDASVDPGAVNELLRHLDGETPIVAADSEGRPTDHCLATIPGWWAEHRPSDFSDALGRAALLDLEVRHDLRCGPPPERPLVVASMIVRDEEETLPGCLASLEGFVDRVVVCDTGSTDRTVAVARAAGAQVVSTEWVDDFAAARNVALRHCTDAEFVLWIDADERLRVDDHEQVRKALAGGNHPETYLIEVESVRTDGPASVGLAQRLFRPDGLHFEGALHEQLRRRDGSAPTGKRFPHIRLVHLGYQSTDNGEKRRRNLAIARRQHAASPSAKSALDLARSLAYAGAPPDEVMAVLDDGLDIAAPDDPIRARIQSMQAGLAFDAGDPVVALELALAAFGSDPGDDVAAALAARAAAELGRDSVAVDVAQRLTGGGTLIVPRNQAIVFAYGAAAGLRIGQTSDARRWLRQAATILEGSADCWQVLLSALDTIDTETLWDALQSVPDLQPAAVVAAARDLGDHERAMALESLAGIRAGASAATGITLSFSGLRLPVDVDRLAAVIPSRRRVLDWTGSGSLSERLRPRSFAVTTATAAQILDGSAPIPGRQIDIAVGGVDSSTEHELLSAIRRVLDPAGLMIVWPQDDAGNALTGPAARERTEQLHRALKATGFLAEPDMPLGVVAGRPVWDAASFATKASTDGETVASVRIVSNTPIPDELQQAYRASLPELYQLEFGDAGAGAPAPNVTLVTDPSIMPDPRWVQLIVDSALEDGTTCGVAVIDQSGRVVQAGVDGDGQALAAGADAAGPLLAASRPNARLLPPYAVPGAASSGVDGETGTLIGTPPAITLLDRTTAQATTRLRDLFPRPVLLLGGPAPGTATPDQQAELEKLADRLAEAGRTVVYQWDDGGAAVDPWDLAAWRRRGIVTFPPSPLRRNPSRFAPDLARPRADALVTAFRPEVVVYLSPGALEWDYTAAARCGGEAPSVYAGPALPAQLRARADVVGTLADLADEILAAQPSQPARPSEVPRIPPVDQRAGMVSIVIPVHNRWELTAACLDSIAAHTPQPHEIILVDNGSTDATAAEVVHRPVHVVTNPVNRGFPAAVNQGIAAAQGEFVCILNNDTEVTAGWMDAMLHALSIDGTGLVGPRSNEVAGLQRVPEAPSLSDRDAAHDWAESWRKGVGQRTWRIDRLIGFCLLARRDTFERFGGFDEGFGIGNYEDDELGRRLQQHGLNLRVADAAVVLHHGGATFESLDLDYAALIHSGARRFAIGEHPAVHTLGLVLSDGSSAEAAAAAASMLPVAGRVVIAERGPLAATELAAAGVPGAAVDVVACDWADATAAAALAESLPGEMLLVVGATERLQLTDWGAARAEIEGFGRQPVEVRTSSGSEVRLVPAARDAVEAVGTHSTSRARTFGLA